MAYVDPHTVTEYLALADVRHGHLYRLRSRNLALGVYDGAGGFVGIREKFDSIFLFTEYHWDYGGPYGTVKPIEYLGELPNFIRPRTHYDTVDKASGRIVDIALPEPERITSSYWYFVDTGEPAGDISTTQYPNHALFDWLIHAEVQHQVHDHPDDLQLRQDVLAALQDEPADLAEIVAAVDPDHISRPQSAWGLIVLLKRMTHEGLLAHSGGTWQLIG